MPTGNMTFHRIAKSWKLWQRFCDCGDGIFTRKDFDAMPMDERMAFLEAYFYYE